MGTNIYDAAVYGDLDQVREIVEAHPEAVNETDEYGFTPLHGLAGEEHVEIAQFLIDRGAEVNAANDEGITPLHLATWPAGHGHTAAQEGRRPRGPLCAW
jgi:uncharacterized protein